LLNVIGKKERFLKPEVTEGNDCKDKETINFLSPHQKIEKIFEITLKIKKSTNKTIAQMLGPCPSSIEAIIWPFQQIALYILGCFLAIISTSQLVHGKIDEKLPYYILTPQTIAFLRFITAE
jgi:hypothetical protein